MPSNDSPLNPNENIVRAATQAHWDPVKDRWSSQLFTGTHISVGRLSISTLSELFSIFNKQLKQAILKAGEINVGTLQQIALNHDPPLEITVLPKPLKDYEAHAEIEPKIPRGLAHKIIQSLIFHDPPQIINQEQ